MSKKSLEELNVNDIKKRIDIKKKNLAKLVVGKGLEEISIDGVLRFRTNAVTTPNVSYWTQWVVLLDFFDAISMQDLSFSDRANLAVFGDVLLRCDDPSFLYHGFSYILTSLDSNADNYPDWDTNLGPEKRPPNVTNPERKGIVCKHLVQILNILPFKVSSVAKAMKEFVENGTISFSQAGLAYVTKDGVPHGHKAIATKEEPEEKQPDTDEKEPKEIDGNTAEEEETEEEKDGNKEGESNEDEIEESIRFTEGSEKYPNRAWIKLQLRWNTPRIRYKVLDTFIIGSEAKGTAHKDSDLDIAIIIPEVKNKTALKITDHYHSNFLSDAAKPHWNGRIVDFQFFYEDDPELETYSKIPIKESIRFTEGIETKTLHFKGKLFPYQIQDGLCVFDLVDLSYMNLNSLQEFKHVVDGDYSVSSLICSHNNLTDLQGSPLTANNLSCRHNPLTSLQGAPVIHGEFDCSYSKLKDLEGSPTGYFTSYYCVGGVLESLKGSPRFIDGIFDCSDNRITTLEGSPDKIYGNFNFNLNLVEDLKDAPIVTGSTNFYNNPFTGGYKEAGKYFSQDLVAGRHYGLVEATGTKVYDRFKDDMDRETFNAIVATDPLTVPAPEDDSEQKYIGPYSKWLLRIYKKGNLPLDDLYKASEYLTIFDKRKSLVDPDRRDLNKLKHLPELYNLLVEFGLYVKRTKSEITTDIRKAKKDIEIFYEDEDWIVVIPKTVDASIYWGQNSQWCTASRGDNNYFNFYDDRGTLYIIINKEGLESDWTKSENKSQIFIGHKIEITNLSDSPMLLSYVFEEMGDGRPPFASDLDTLIQNKILEEFPGAKFDAGDIEYYLKDAVSEFVDKSPELFNVKPFTVSHPDRSLHDYEMKEFLEYLDLDTLETMSRVYRNRNSLSEDTTVSLDDLVGLIQGDVALELLLEKAIDLGYDYDSSEGIDIKRIFFEEIADTYFDHKGYISFKTQLDLSDEYDLDEAINVYNGGELSNVYLEDMVDSDRMEYFMTDDPEFIPDVLNTFERDFNPQKFNQEISDYILYILHESTLLESTEPLPSWVQVLQEISYVQRKKFFGGLLPDEMTKEEFINPQFPEVAEDEIILYHAPNYVEHIADILRDGLRIDKKGKHSEGPSNVMWFALTPSGYREGGVVIGFKVKKDDPALNLNEFGNGQAGLYRDTTPDELVFFDMPGFSSVSGALRISEERKSEYADKYYEAYSSNSLHEATGSQLYKYYDSQTKELSKSVTRSEFNSIVALDPLTVMSEDDPGEQKYIGPYSKWLLKMYMDQKLPQEDWYKAEEYLAIFDKHKKKLLVALRDINKYKKLSEIFQVLLDHDLYTKQTKSEIRTGIHRGKNQVYKLYEDDKWLVIIPQTKEASIYWGLNTQWCTASRGERNEFDDYVSIGSLYIIIKKEGEDFVESEEKYQIHVDLEEYTYDDRLTVMDINDSEEDFGYLLSKIDSVDFNTSLFRSVLYDNTKVGANISSVVFMLKLFVPPYEVVSPEFLIEFTNLVGEYLENRGWIKDSDVGKDYISVEKPLEDILAFADISQGYNSDWSYTQILKILRGEDDIFTDWYPDTPEFDYTDIEDSNTQDIMFQILDEYVRLDYLKLSDFGVEDVADLENSQILEITNTAAFYTVFMDAESRAYNIGATEAFFAEVKSSVTGPYTTFVDYDTVQLSVQTSILEEVLIGYAIETEDVEDLEDLKKHDMDLDLVFEVPYHGFESFNQSMFDEGVNEGLQEMLNELRTEIVSEDQKEFKIKKTLIQSKLMEGYQPKKTITAYKLFRTVKSQPGKIFPLFIGRTIPTPTGEWIEAEALQTKGFAFRPGWHCGILPTAPHLKRKDGTMSPDRVWAEVEVPADVDWQSIADASSTRDIRDEIPKDGYYRFRTNKLQGGAWIIGGAIKVTKILTPEEVAKILTSHGITENIHESLTYYNYGEVPFTFSEFYSREVEELGNYTKLEVNKWQDKYNIKPLSKVIWITKKPEDALRYSMGADENTQNLSLDDLQKVSAQKGFIIPESDDGDGGYLFIYTQIQESKLLDSDSEYMKAVEAENLYKCQEMVSQKAKEAGYTIGPVYHGSINPGIKIFQTGGETEYMGSYWAPDRGVAEIYSDNTFSQEGVSTIYTAYLKLQKLADLVHNEEAWSIAIRGYLKGSTPTYASIDTFLSWGSEMWHILDGEDGQKAVVALQKAGYDSVLFWEENIETYVVFNPTQIKLADPITYDDNGEVVPLSKRFDSGSLDIREAKTSIKLAELPESVIKDFNDLAQAQRGDPEAAMLKVQEVSDGGLLGWVCEHVGDLTHRMSQSVDFFKGNHGIVADKVNKTLRSLTHPYGFEKETEEQLESNYRFHKEKGRLEQYDSYRQFRDAVNEALLGYAEAHSKLPVYNKAQELARDSAVALGHGVYSTAIFNLKKLKEVLDKGQEAWEEFALSYSDSIPPVLYHATYKPLLKSIKENGLGGAGSEKRWEDSVAGKVYLATDSNVAESYAETCESVPEEWLEQIIVLSINTKGLDVSRFNLDTNVIDNTGDTLEYEGIIPMENIKFMESKLQEMAKPSERISEEMYFHGTFKKEYADKIWKDGIQPNQISTYSTSQTPVAGKVYLTKYLHVALGYAFKYVEDMEAEDYGYIFEIPGTSLEDVFPDEDHIGQVVEEWFMHQSVLKPDPQFAWVDKYKEFLSMSVYEYAELFPGDFKHDYEIDDLADSYPDILTGAKEGWFSYKVMTGKLLQDKLTEEEIFSVINKFGNIAHKGAVYPTAMWELEMFDSSAADYTVEDAEYFEQNAELIASR